MARCPRCTQTFCTLADEDGMHDCPHCGLRAEEASDWTRRAAPDADADDAALPAIARHLRCLASALDLDRYRTQNQRHTAARTLDRLADALEDIDLTRRNDLTR